MNPDEKLSRFVAALLEASPTARRRYLSGRSGKNRPRNQAGQVTPSRWVSGNDDFAAIATWWAAHRASERTSLVYRREALRLLRWAILIKKMPLSDLTKADLNEYLAFLANPPLEWCGPRKPMFTKSGAINPAWRPFVNPLDSSSIHNAEQVLAALFAWLTCTEYLLQNPWPSMRGSRRRLIPPNPAGSNLKYFSASELAAINAAAAQCGPRAEWMIALLRNTGIRPDEAVSLQMKDFHFIDRMPSLTVRGRHGIMRRIPVPYALLDAFITYREQMLCAEVFPSADDNSPMVTGAWKRPLSNRQFCRLISDLGDRAAQAQETICVESADRLRKLTPGWYRRHYLAALRAARLPEAFIVAVSGQGRVHGTNEVVGAEYRDLHRAVSTIWF